MLKLLILFILQTGVLNTVDGHHLSQQARCSWSKDDLSDMEYIEPFIFNKINLLEYNSTLGRFVGFTEKGIEIADSTNRHIADLLAEKTRGEIFCRHNVEIYYSDTLFKTVEPHVKVKLVKQSGGSHPAVLMCSAYSFYPKLIRMTWIRNGKKVEGDVTSTEEMADGDWYYQVHSYLEYMPKSGEEISCVVEHASFKKPMSYKWDPSVPEPDKSKISIGVSGLVLGIVLSAAGFIYYKKKCTGRILVPT